MSPRTVALFALLCLPGVAAAQAVLTFDHLADRLNAGDRVRIVDTAGHVQIGAVVALSADAVSLRREGALVRLPRADVREVWVRHHDAVTNGAFLGFAGVAAGYCALAVSWDNPQQCGIPAVFLGGLGAGLGALVDAAISRQRLVFRAEARVTWRLVPVRGGAGGGATLQWR